MSGLVTAQGPLHHVALAAEGSRIVAEELAPKGHRRRTVLDGVKLVTQQIAEITPLRERLGTTRHQVAIPCDVDRAPGKGACRGANPKHADVNSQGIPAPH